MLTRKKSKKAFRKLAQQYHPDKNPGDKTAEAQVQRTSTRPTPCSSDPDKRAKYDKFGSQWEQYERAGGRPEDFDWGNCGGGRVARAAGGGYAAHPSRRRSSSRCLAVWAAAVARWLLELL